MSSFFLCRYSGSTVRELLGGSGSGDCGGREWNALPFPPVAVSGLCLGGVDASAVLVPGSAWMPQHCCLCARMPRHCCLSTRMHWHCCLGVSRCLDAVAWVAFKGVVNSSYSRGPATRTHAL
jgi:hypothetical protein